MDDHGSSFPLSTPAAILIGAAIVAVAILISGGVIKLQGYTSTQPSQPQTAQAAASASPAPTFANVTVGNLPVLGNPNAKVTIVEWADFQCPFCERFFTDDEQQLKKDYVDTGKVKYAFRDFAFLGQPTTDPAGDESTNAANAARCANEQGKFWEFHDYLYNHQGQEDGGTFSKDNLKKFAADLGLNTDQFNQCVDSDKYVNDVKADMSAGKTAGVSGTPTVYINGQQFVGAQPYATIKAAIDSALASAK